MTKTLTLASAVVLAAASHAFAQPPRVPVPPPVPPAPTVDLTAVPEQLLPPMPPMPPMPAIPIVEMPAFPALPQGPAVPVPAWPSVPDFAWEPGSFLDDAKPFSFAFGDQKTFAEPSPAPKPSVMPSAVGNQGRDDNAYEQARNLIERDQYDRAIPVLERVIAGRGTRADAAMYWKAYSLSKLSRGADSLATLADLQKQFPQSRWLADARALEVEVRQSSGQAVNPNAQADDDQKLLALQGLLRTDPETALPIIEKLLAGTSSVRVKDRALFVVTQSRSTRGREILVNVAKGSSNPDLQLRAIRYLGQMSSAENLPILDEVYRSTNDVAVKRAVLRSFLTANARDRLLSAARSEQSMELRREAVQQLGALRAVAELEELYRAESNDTVKRAIIQALFVANAYDKLAPLARSEKDPELRRTAIRNLALSNRQEASDVLVSIYNSDSSMDVRRSIVDALAMQRNGGPLIALARTEKNAEMKTHIVRRLSTMNSPEVREYLLELLK